MSQGIDEKKKTNCFNVHILLSFSSGCHIGFAIVAVQSFIIIFLLLLLLIESSLLCNIFLSVLICCR